VAEVSGPAGMTELSAGRVAVVVAEAVVARTTELGTSRAVKVLVADGAVAVQDGRKQG